MRVHNLMGDASFIMMPLACMGHGPWRITPTFHADLVKSTRIAIMEPLVRQEKADHPIRIYYAFHFLLGNHDSTSTTTGNIVFRSRS